MATVAGVMLVLCLTELLPETLENVPPRVRLALLVCLVRGLAHEPPSMQEAVLSNIAGMFLMFISKTIMAQYVN